VLMPATIVFMPVLTIPAVEISNPTAAVLLEDHLEMADPPTAELLEPIDPTGAFRTPEQIAQMRNRQGEGETGQVEAEGPAGDPVYLEGMAQLALCRIILNPPGLQLSNHLVEVEHAVFHDEINILNFV